MRLGRLRIGTWLALLALYGQVLAGVAPAPAAWVMLHGPVICHADGSPAPGPSDRQDDRGCPPCALCAGLSAASVLLLLAPPSVPLPRQLATSAAPRAPPAPSAPARAVIPPARGPPLV